MEPFFPFIQIYFTLRRWKRKQKKAEMKASSKANNSNQEKKIITKRRHDLVHQQPKTGRENRASKEVIIIKENLDAWIEL
jgi:hypothetical protein